MKKEAKSKTRLYKVFQSMKQRCYNKNNPSYRYYGAKGVTICDEWLNDYDSFATWAKENGYRVSLNDSGQNKCTIDRIDPSKGYSPENCRWISNAENASRASLARSVESWKAAHMKTRHTFDEWGYKPEVDYRIKQLNGVITLLASLNKSELCQLKHMILDYLDAREHGWDATKYFEHGLKPFK